MAIQYKEYMEVPEAKTSDDLVIEDATVTVPAGFYPTGASANADAGFVRFTAQTLTTEQQEQAQSNIGITVATDSEVTTWINSNLINA